MTSAILISKVQPCPTSSGAALLNAHVVIHPYQAKGGHSLRAVPKFATELGDPAYRGYVTPVANASVVLMEESTPYLGL